MRFKDSKLKQKIVGSIVGSLFLGTVGLTTASVIYKLATYEGSKSREEMYQEKLEYNDKFMELLKQSRFSLR